VAAQSIEVGEEELKRAWKRVKIDHKFYRFVNHPHALD